MKKLMAVFFLVFFSVSVFGAEYYIEKRGAIRGVPVGAQKFEVSSEEDAKKIQNNQEETAESLQKIGTLVPIPKKTTKQKIFFWEEVTSKSTEAIVAKAGEDGKISVRVVPYPENKKTVTGFSLTQTLIVLFFAFMIWAKIVSKKNKEIAEIICAGAAILATLVFATLITELSLFAKELVTLIPAIGFSLLAMGKFRKLPWALAMIAMGVATVFLFI